MRLIAAITDPKVARRILEHLSILPRAPLLAPASGFGLEPVSSRGGYEATWAEADGDPGFDFDESQAEGQASNQFS